MFAVFPNCCYLCLDGQFVLVDKIIFVQKIDIKLKKEEKNFAVLKI